jgi:glycosylphosphatidylinositol transamidase (GPIT) subunit GPI8
MYIYMYTFMAQNRFVFTKEMGMVLSWFRKKVRLSQFGPACAVLIDASKNWHGVKMTVEALVMYQIIKRALSTEWLRFFTVCLTRSHQ